MWNNNITWLNMFVIEVPEKGSQRQKKYFEAKRRNRNILF